MTLVLLLLVIFGGVALIISVDRSAGAARRLAREAETGEQALPPEVVETLVLRLPEPQRGQAWRLLCEVADAQAAAQAAPDRLDPRTTYLLDETRQTYLPETLWAYLALTEGARDRLAAQGQPAGTLLAEQLALMEGGVRGALRHDHAAADRLLTQGRFLRERFQAEGGELRLPTEESSR